MQLSGSDLPEEFEVNCCVERTDGNAQMKRYVVPVLSAKAYREIRGIAPLIRHLDTRWR